MRFRFSGDPVQDEVGRRHQDHVAGISIEWVLARSKWPFPHAPFAFGHTFTVTECCARQVSTQPTRVTDNHADIADRDDGFWFHLHSGEPAVDEIGTIGQSGVLSATTTASPEKRFGVL